MIICGFQTVCFILVILIVFPATLFRGHHSRSSASISCWPYHQPFCFNRVLKPPVSLKPHLTTVYLAFQISCTTLTYFYSTPNFLKLQLPFAKRSLTCCFKIHKDMFKLHMTLSELSENWNQISNTLALAFFQHFFVQLVFHPPPEVQLGLPNASVQLGSGHTV